MDKRAFGTNFATISKTCRSSLVGLPSTVILQVAGPESDKDEESTKGLSEKYSERDVYREHWF